jgi:hypothetical protein
VGLTASLSWTSAKLLEKGKERLRSFFCLIGYFVIAIKKFLVIVKEKRFICVILLMASKAKTTAEMQKLVGVSTTTPEQKKQKYDEWSEKALDDMEAKQPRKKTIVKERRTALRARGFYSD